MKTLLSSALILFSLVSLAQLPANHFTVPRIGSLEAAALRKERLLTS